MVHTECACANFFLKFAIKSTGHISQHMVEYTEKLGRLRIASSPGLSHEAKADLVNTMV